MRPSFCNIVTSCSRRLLTCSRALTRCLSRDDNPLVWRAGSPDWEGASEVGVDCVEDGLVEVAVTVIAEVAG